MSVAEKVWALTNINYDLSIENRKFEILLMHINPAIAAAKEESELTVSTDFIEDIEKNIGRKLSEEEIQLIMTDESLDIIG